MAKEIERKFEIIDNSYQSMAVRTHFIRQCYISVRKDATVRIRIKDDQAYITVKSLVTGISRDEWEYPIPLCDAEEMMDRCRTGRIIEKRRYIVPFDGHVWEVDKFGGALDGIVIAEIELDHDDDRFIIPPFVGKEVTGDVRYYNSNLAAEEN